MSTRTVSEAFDSFNREIRPFIDDEDTVALSEEWNNYTDGLSNDGQLSALLYRLCPAVGDVWPSDDDMAVVANAIGLTMTAKRVEGRSDGALWPAGARHFLVTLKIANRTMAVQYSMGSGLKGDPTVDDVLCSILLEIEGVQGLAVDNESDLSQWCDEFGFDANSRQARRTYRSCIDEREKFVTLTGDAISESEFCDLREIVE